MELVGRLDIVDPYVVGADDEHQAGREKPGGDPMKGGRRQFAEDDAGEDGGNAEALAPAPAQAGKAA